MQQDLQLKKRLLKLFRDSYKINMPFGWKDIEISNNEQGRPQLNFIGINLNEIEDMDLSISHCKEYAVANVTVLKR